MNKKKSAPAKSPARTKRAGRARADSPVNEAGEQANATSRKSARRARSDSAVVERRAEEQQAENTSFPVVGIGASAGGLEAFRQLLEHMPVDTGMAFVLVQHLDPTHESILTELLSRSTRMPVSEVTDGMAIAPDHLYVIPRNTNLAISAGVLRLLPREEARGRHRPIDYFLRTLAEDQGHRAIGVILSGTASDGTLGLEAIKAEGGITFAEDPKSAKYDSMPRSAIAAGHVDFILTPEGIAAELALISRHPCVSPPTAATPVEEEAQPRGRNGFRKILALLRKAKDVDFTDYKANTLHRRISRRMVLNKLESMEDYAGYLRENPAEVEALYQDILINVTSFFRNPETFEVLKERIFPKVIEHRAPDEPIRIWTLGCSTGEEAYSIAISFAEFAGDQAEHIPIQIFATDLSDRGIEKARAGLYSKDISEDVSPERLRRFFTEADGGYRISKPIRDMVVFARQNVLADPPFSRVDLISCRNLLIYLEPVLQKRVLPTLHYALKPAGVLWLGSSESVGAASDLFTPEDKKHRFYSKKPGSPRLHFKAASGDSGRQSAGPGQKTNYVGEPARTGHDAEKEADRILLARYSPASVIVNAELEILQFRGSTGAYLEPPAGKATLNLLKMAREGLMLPLRAAIQKAKKDDATIRKEGLRVNYDGESRQVNLEVVPITGLAANERSFLVLFEPASPQQNLGQETKPRAAQAGRTKRKTEDRRVAPLQEELAATREYMQSLVEQQEAANEELQSSSEELQSSNEELQSINEELETAKEELESSNEELATLNDELHNRNQELTTLNDDLSNLHVSTNLPILMLGRDLRIRSFTPQAEKVLSLIATDVGRPISDIKPNIHVSDLEALIAEVIDTVSVREREVQDRDGRWYAMRVRPYKTLDNRIDGAVLVLVDIDALKRSEAEIREARDYAEAVIRTVRDPLLVLNADLRVHTANEAFYRTFKVSPAESQGRLIYELGNRQWEIPRLRELLEEILPRNSFFNNFEVTIEFETIGQRTMLLNARRIDDATNQPARILLGIEDVTELLQFQAELRRSEIRYRRLFEAARDGVLLMDPATRKILDANPYMTELLDYTHEELLGKELFEIGLLKDEEASRAAFRELQEQGFIRYEDLPLETKTGERREVEFVSNLYYEDGEEVIQCNIRDVTGRKQAEEAHSRLAAIVESSGDAIISKTLEGVITSWNASAERLFGYRAEEMIGQPIMILIPPDHRDEETEILERLRRGERIEHFETVRMAKNGQRIDVSLSVSPILDRAGRVIGASKIARDITERKEAEEVLRQIHAELRSQTEELTRFNRVAVGRELRMIELKKEVNELCQQQGEAARYPLEFEQEGNETRKSNTR
jgi:two-component system, chemotaxis family, CheB/CheR fusion protein